jgi:hypothetical protein
MSAGKGWRLGRGDGGPCRARRGPGRRAPRRGSRRLAACTSPGSHTSRLPALRIQTHRPTPARPPARICQKLQRTNRPGARGASRGNAEAGRPLQAAGEARGTRPSSGRDGSRVTDNAKAPTLLMRPMKIRAIAGRRRLNVLDSDRCARVVWRVAGRVGWAPVRRWRRRRPCPPPPPGRSRTERWPATPAPASPVRPAPPGPQPAHGARTRQTDPLAHPLSAPRHRGPSPKLQQETD